MFNFVNFEYDPNLGVFKDKDNLNHGIIEYRDGSEDYLSSIFENTSLKNVGYPVELQHYIKDWPSMYSLSYRRVNLLEAIKELFKKDWVVLELGGGTGALTSWLTEYFSQVDVFEGSLERAKILRKRLRERENLNVFVSNILKAKFSRTYNLVTLVGVLEYLNVYSGEETQKELHTNFLKRVYNHLEEDGILLV
ncbi:MAG: class I SAM-dependent methyltransferase, partial [Candidatus Micrarchaeota archaeon]|nr:class I SAM-dependent methyltransferase [Candidatus Micrarchaeota archaeon]